MHGMMPVLSYLFLRLDISLFKSMHSCQIRMQQGKRGFPGKNFESYRYHELQSTRNQKLILLKQICNQIARVKIDFNAIIMHAFKE